MRCPACDAEMRAGRTSVERSTFGAVLDVVGVLTGGNSSTPRYLYFRQDGDVGEAICVEHSRPAFYCAECQSLLISGITQKPGAEDHRLQEQPETPYRTNCPACGAAITPEDARCPECEIVLR